MSRKLGKNIWKTFRQEEHLENLCFNRYDTAIMSCWRNVWSSSLDRPWSWLILFHQYFPFQLSRILFCIFHAGLSFWRKNYPNSCWIHHNYRLIEQLIEVVGLQWLDLSGLPQTRMLSSFETFCLCLNSDVRHGLVFMVYYLFRGWIIFLYDDNSVSKCQMIGSQF